MNKVFIVYADTYPDSWGTEIEIFAVCTTAEEAEFVDKEVRRQGFSPRVLVSTPNKIERKLLGGYYE